MRRGKLVETNHLIRRNFRDKPAWDNKYQRSNYNGSEVEQQQVGKRKIHRHIINVIRLGIKLNDMKKLLQQHDRHTNNVSPQ